MIEVCDDQTPPMLRRQAVQNGQQHQRINAARHANQDRLARLKEPPSSNGIFNHSQQAGHADSLWLRRKTGKRPD